MMVVCPLIQKSKLSFADGEKEVVADLDGVGVADPGESEMISSWALFIQVTLLILALFCSYYLQLKKIQAVHETVISIFAGELLPLHLPLPGRTGGANGGWFEQECLWG